MSDFGLNVDIDAIVREVLASLGGEPSATYVTKSPVAESPAKESPGAARVDDKVITLAAIEGLPSGTQRVVVRRGAIVTPAVRDELSRKGIELATRGEEQAVAEPNAECEKTSVLIVRNETKFDPATIGGQLAATERTFENVNEACVAKASELVGDKALDGGVAVLFTSHAAAALCVANRAKGVRAIRGDNADGVVKDAKAVGANVLIVDPAGKGSYVLANIVRAFLATSENACPDALRACLG